ncbi:MAG TPA: invasion associated locus B family protein [Alphaproteobacteria bacterium]
MRPFVRVFAALAVVLAAAPVAAQKPAKRAESAAPPGPRALGTFDAWTAVEMTERGSKICYILSRPAKSEPANVRRGDVLLMVTHRPAANRRDEVSFQAGYSYKAGAEVAVEVDKAKKFEFFTKPDADADGAWTRDAAADKALIEAMRAGTTLTVKGASARGTETVDTFSLIGFSKAYAEIGKACGIR